MTDNVKLDGEVAVESVSPGQNEVSDLLIAEISLEVSYRICICIHFFIQMIDDKKIFQTFHQYSKCILCPLQYLCFFLFLMFVWVYDVLYIFNLQPQLLTTKQIRIQM